MPIVANFRKYNDLILFLLKEAQAATIPSVSAPGLTTGIVAATVMSAVAMARNKQEAIYGKTIPA